MENICTGCGERWPATEPTDSPEDFTTGPRSVIRHCPACGPRSRAPVNADALHALGDILGDDMDGMASMIEDFGL